MRRARQYEQRGYEGEKQRSSPGVIKFHREVRIYGEGLTQPES